MRYKIIQDNDYHWYLVKVVDEGAFNTWLQEDTESDSFDPEGHPGKPIEGPHLLTFTEPKEG